MLGGTHDKDQWDLEPRESDARFIRDGCNSLFPSLEVSAGNEAVIVGFVRCQVNVFFSFFVWSTESGSGTRVDRLATWTSDIACGT